MFDQILQEILGRKYAFLGAFFVVVFVTYALLVWIDFIPESPEAENVAETLTDKPAGGSGVTERPGAAVAADPTPDMIHFPSLGREVAVVNPVDASVAALDDALLSGVVRHPESGDLMSEGTMFLFGHSSYLPVVYNKNFQAFNGIQDLEWGDQVIVQSSDFEYVYRVDRVYEAKASEASVELIDGRSRLVLATCNTFAAKEDRHIVEATLVDSYAR